MRYGEPTHIDFITTHPGQMYEGQSSIKGYWFITFILGPGNIVIWRKRIKYGWLREVGGQSFEPEVLSDAVYRDYKGRLITTPGGILEQRLDGLLSEHQKKTGKTGYPYNYYEDQN